MAASSGARTRLFPTLRMAAGAVGALSVGIFTADNLVSLQMVSGRSMQPALNPDSSMLWRDVLLMDKRARDGLDEGLLRRGDVVTLRSPTNPELLLIKRIIALPHDCVVPAGCPDSYVRVPKGQCWVEGDESFHSGDSNSFGPVPLALVTGKAVTPVWPPWRIGARISGVPERWDDNDDDNGDGAPAAPTNDVAPESPSTEAPAKRRAEKAYTADVDINDSDNRQTLAKSSTHRSIRDATDAEVTTRGRHYINPDVATATDPALHLHIEASSQESLDQAIAMIDRLKNEAAEYSQATSPPPPITPTRHIRPGSAAGSMSGGHVRLQEKVFVDIESERGFNVRAKLIGTGGENMKYIQSTTGARVQVRGRGSGYNDREGNADPYEPMHLYVTSGSEEALAQAKGYCQSLIDTIRSQFHEFKQSGGNSGRRRYDAHSHDSREGRDYSHGHHQQPQRGSYQHDRPHQRTRNHRGSRNYTYEGSPSYYDSNSPASGYGNQYPQQQQQQQNYGTNGYDATSAAAPLPAAATPTSADASAYGDYAEYYAQYYQYYGTYPDYSAYYGTADHAASEPTTAEDSGGKPSAGADSPSSSGYHSVPPPPSYANGNNKV
ncbi:hypothetical protein LPJ57_006817 [Coemansia sp. RSA 486]|nr:hypothetical protein LPJ57_006817 [Coemansia sp. RSA 486]